MYYIWGITQGLPDLPWHYGLVYMFITTPVLYVILFLIGTGIFAFTIISKILKIDNYLKDESVDSEDEKVNYIWLEIKQFYQRYRFLFFHMFLFFGPLTAILTKGSILYDGWRHLYFLYYGFIFIVIYAVYFIENKFNHLKISYFISGIIVVNFIVVGWFMIKYHPHQQVYFNFLAGKEPISNFEGDYWGVATRQAFEYIEKTDNNSKILVTTRLLPRMFLENKKYLKNPDRIEMSQLGLETTAYDPSFESVYYLTNYRWEDYSPNHDKEVFNIMVKDNKIVQLIKLR